MFLGYNNFHLLMTCCFQDDSSLKPKNTGSSLRGYVQGLQPKKATTNNVKLLTAIFSEVNSARFQCIAMQFVATVTDSGNKEGFYVKFLAGWVNREHHENHKTVGLQAKTIRSALAFLYILVHLFAVLVKPTT